MLTEASAPTPEDPNDLLATLTPQQREAVQHIDGPLLILAGPGSGKTRVVTHRVAHLLRHGVRAAHILALTFTNKAAQEMQQRLARLAPNESVWMGTFHRFCARQLRRHASLVGLSENFSIYDTDASGKALSLAIEDLGLPLVHYTPDQIAKAISWAKNRLILAEDYTAGDGRPLGAIVAQVYPQYQKRLLAANAVDFDDLLLHVARLLQENPELRASLDERYRYIMVDEYQDTNLAQYAIVRALSVDHPNLAVTGDPDQSIYGWRGANLSNILEFENDFPDVRVVRLERNYRSTPNILQVADQLISNNLRRKAKSLYTARPEGAPVRLIVYPTAHDEADDIALRIATELRTQPRRPRDYAIFYRVNALSRLFEHSLRKHGVPYQIVNGLEFFQRAEIRDIVAYLQLLNNPTDDIALLRVINRPPRGIGRTTLNRLAEHARRYELSLLEAARESGLIEALNSRAVTALSSFVALYERLSRVATAPVEAIIGHILSETGYRDRLVQSDAPEDLERVANIDELLAAAREFDMAHPDESPLEQFLEQAALVSDTDAWEAQNDKVSLMTLHSAKGLEFPVVFVVAIEEGLLPHQRSRENDEAVEEERRLLFVGITRAEQELQLSMAQYRALRGELWPTVASNFLMEVPRHAMEVVEPVRPATPQYQPDYEEVVREHTEPQEQTPPTTVAATPSRLRTAAEMLGQAAAAKPRVAPHLFHQGMLVNHPEYGPGTIVALSGEGEKRTATVRFFSSSEQKSFRLKYSPLQPVRS